MIMSVNALEEGEFAAADWEEIAAKAYDAYASVTGGRNFLGDPMPRWGALPDLIRRAWVAAAQSVAVSTLTIVMRARLERGV
jgi:hypothetical protein